MKVWIILLSILAAAGTWWWHIHRAGSVGARGTLGQRLKIFSKSFIAGVVVYFVLMSAALIYLMATNP